MNNTGNNKPDDIPESLASDRLEIITNGGVVLEQTLNNKVSPEEQLHGGEHHKDTALPYRRPFVRHSMDKDDPLPRDLLHARVKNGGFKRPTPKKWATSTN